MRYKLFMALILSVFMGNMAFAAMDEGIEYKRVSPSLPTITKNKIEVVELFWYGCSHCFRFEPNIKKWIKNKPDNVVYIRIPAVFNPSWELHARAFYAATSLGLFAEGKLEFHDAFFHALHKQKKRLNNKNTLRSFFARFGVSAEDFNNTFNSFAVNTKVNRAISLSKRYQVEGVPTMIVNGKYRTDGPMAGGRGGIIKVLDFLVKKESNK